MQRSAPAQLTFVGLIHEHCVLALSKKINMEGEHDEGIRNSRTGNPEPMQHFQQSTIPTSRQLGIGVLDSGRQTSLVLVPAWLAASPLDA